MLNVSSKIARGAAWMVGLRLLQRSLGLISTVVLARMLVPADFGLVAMALSFYALVELFSMVGFDLAIIRRKDAQRVHYDTAWTLGIGLKALVGLLLAFSAPFAADFYGDARLEPIVHVLALVSLLSGLENIGIVSFRKELDFHLEFRFQLTKKVFSVVSTVAMAFYFRSYWALVFGMLASTVLGVVLSYLMHSYRPRLTIAAWREMTGFSLAVVFNNVVSFCRDRGPDFIIGRFLAAGPLGAYRVAGELASLPTTQLYMPVMRAVFPGYAKISDDVPALRAAYLSTQAVLIAVVMPVAVAMALLAQPIVSLLLGANWQAAVPLLQILALSGATRVLHGNRHALFMARGRPHWVGLLVLLEAAILLPLVAFWMWRGEPVEMAAWARVIASLLVLPVGVGFISRVVSLGRFDFIATMWRPLVGCAAMGAVVFAARLPESVGPFWVMVVHGLLAVFAYVMSVFFLWRVCGRPMGFERTVLGVVAARGGAPARFALWLLG